MTYLRRAFAGGTLYHGATKALAAAFPGLGMMNAGSRPTIGLSSKPSALEALPVFDT